MTKKLGIGLIGAGTVASGFVEVLKPHTSSFEIIQIAVKHLDRQRNENLFPKSLLTNDPESIVRNPAVDIIVELTPDAELALELARVCNALQKPFITANKKMVAENLAELASLNATIRYEASVCGSIPILQLLDNFYAQPGLIQQITGIFNGTTNYILTRALEEGLSYETALTEAQALGYAEANPWLDVSGMDATCKLSIAGGLAFGVHVGPERIPTVGIEGLNQNAILYATEQGCKLKLIPAAHKTPNGIAMYTLPAFVPPNSPFYQITAENNALNIAGTGWGDHFYKGRGAGAGPTGSAVLADLFQYNLPYRYPKGITPLQNDDQFQLKLWATASDSVQTLEPFFEPGAKVLSNNTLQGTINLGQLTKLINLKVNGFFCAQCL